jgi:hypothetical protein
MEKRPTNKQEWTEYLEERGFDLIEYQNFNGDWHAILGITCKECGYSYEAKASNVIRRKKGLCPKCGDYRPYTTEEIIECIEKNGGTYISGEVLNKESRIKFKCGACNSTIEKKAHDIRRTKKGCINCRPDRMKRTIRKERNHLKKAKAVAEERGGKCLSTDANIITKNKLLWECSLGHTWKATSDSVLNQGTWCPQCASSRGERTVRALFEACFEADFPQTRPHFLKRPNFHLDGYNRELKLAFEVNGIQHYQLNAKFHISEDNLKSQKLRDRNKAQLCKRHGVILITVPHWVIEKGITKIREFVSDALTTLGITPLNNPQKVKIDPLKIYDAQTDDAFRKFKSIVTENGGHFDPAEYLGRTFSLSVTCNEGHTWKAKPYLILNGHWCPGCAKNMPLNYNLIQSELNKEGWNLDSKNAPYQRAIEPIRMRCPKGHLVKRSWNAWQRQRNNGRITCRECYVESMLEKRDDVERETTEETELV